MHARPLILMLALAPLTIGAQTPTPASKAHARVSLVADSTTFAQAEPTWLGIRFQLDPGWHIYWINPGESGSPPDIEWGFHEVGRRMGDIEWPVPVRLVSGSEVSYGYEDEVVLLAPLRRLPPTMNGGGSTAMVDPPGSVLAMITYVICREVCVMEKASPEIDVPDARSRQSSADVALIDQWQTRMPKPMPTSWKATATLAAESWSIAVNTGHRETEATFFPAQPGLIHDSAPVRIEPTATGLVLHLETSPFFSAAPSTLDGVIVIPNTGAFMIHAPVIK